MLLVEAPPHGIPARLRSGRDAARLIDELYSELAVVHPTLSRPLIRGHIRLAIRDLNGSVASGAMPEMIVRLVEARLVAVERSRADRSPVGAEPPAGLLARLGGRR